MPRSRRIKSQSGCYHVILRGNEKRPIFLDDEDRLRFLSTLQIKKKQQGFCVYAFCLMNNHIHLMLGEQQADLSDIMKRITVSYVAYFNKKYERIGHLFYDRFKSQNVEDDRYFLTLARYIHQNPVKAGLVKHPGDYRWSSYGCYLDENDPFCRIVDTDMLWELLGEGGRDARREYVEFMNQPLEEDFAFLEEPMDKKEAVLLWEQMLQERKLLSRSGLLDYEDKLYILREFKKKTGLSDKMIIEITGMSRYMLRKAMRLKKDEEGER
ncbi:REP element-mobilizing transposase RayT [Thermosyntropha lipolytica DSM 11003]|uniref:REP element-mobilizing transposase RayT n=1 Tax=Thermosyntropha lipolytica DSM 11003 TaxID=1123382 RepID=A0A1M5Q5T6_9FIRM|nr:transposase [Thermosyntropha lipolytica]SHH09415.1 REP element-mobilizing transposase RayT [Thermosyntropha lipolytica DSM 11003]